MIPMAYVCAVVYPMLVAWFSGIALTLDPFNPNTQQRIVTACLIVQLLTICWVISVFLYVIEIAKTWVNCL